MPPLPPLESTDPGEVLRRIAFYLERSRSDTYRVRAYRNAAAAVEEAGPARVARLGKTGRLADLPNVGTKTAAVIAEAIRGGVPAYLTELEAAANGPVAGGAALRAALRGDCHTHSNWSDGGSPIEEMATTARGLGHEYMVLTDHSRRLTIAHGLDRDRILQQLDVIAEINNGLSPFRILTGMEVDIHEDGSLDMDDDVLDRLDVVVASVHSKLRMASDAMTKRMVTAIANPHTDILGHCTGRKLVGGARPESAFDPDYVFAACARFNTAVEINSRPERLDPPKRLLAMAIEHGCRFTIDTDAHAPGQLDWQPYGCERAELVGVTAEMVWNTGSAEDLLAAVGRHPHGEQV
ncbi:MAG: PHP domain-containing protein [Acidimicrobiales bacterium]